jgi:hypothetical protein
LFSERSHLLFGVSLDGHHDASSWHVISGLLALFGSLIALGTNFYLQARFSCEQERFSISLPLFPLGRINPAAQQTGKIVINT